MNVPTSEVFGLCGPSRRGCGMERVTNPRLRPRLAVSLLATIVVAAGCGTGTTTMGGNGAMMNGYTQSDINCTPPGALAGTTVTVQLGDMGLTSMMGGTAPMGAHMMLQATPATVGAGTVTLLATNLGWRTHELVVLPLTAGASIGRLVPNTTGKVSEAGSLAEASSACGSGAGEGIPSGSASWVTVTLPAGRYELVCNLANHYADGMYAELDVT
jgi:uncharacterized cupredoxin-like copper-binding protein